MSKKAGVVIGDLGLWMSQNGFWKFNGYAQPLDCDVHDDIFTNLNRNQAEKVFAVPNTLFGEVWWFYPRNSAECDSYVVYNYKENHWAQGALGRTCGVDRGAFPYPVRVDAAGNMYQHEVGTDWGGAKPFVRGGPVELGNGDRTMYISRVIPDEKSQGDVSLTMRCRAAPEDPEEIIGPALLQTFTDLHVAARQVAPQLDTVRNTSWRVGTFRLDVRPGGYR
jgi:hypothetical protein